MEQRNRYCGGEIEGDMEPLTTIVATAVAVGAAAGLKDSAKQAVVDAYSGLKGLITSRYRGVDLGTVETKPESLSKRESLAEDLDDAGAGEDLELLAAAQGLIAIVRANAPQTGPAVGVDLARVEAEALRISDVEASGTGVQAVDSTFHGNIDINNVRAGIQGPLDPPVTRRE
ncbi:hypothetical protein [Nocardia sp. NPDC056000]|uniref:hypothetical protein n=1 Tax=Nocardia sp. NPDC056000 TaxID=3345674 RepID=UPI0035DB49FE